MTGGPSHDHVGHTPRRDRPFLPAMGPNTVPVLYDVMTRLLGARPAHRRLVAAADLAPGQTVLEIGCGTGNLLLTAAAVAPGATLVGLDPDPAALERARAKVARTRVSVRLEQGFADELPHPDGSVDRVLSAFMFHHLPRGEKAAMLREVHRVLAPGGRLLLLDYEGHPRPPRLLAPLLHLMAWAGAPGQGHDQGHGHGHGHGHGEDAAPATILANDPATVRELLGAAGLGDVTEVEAADSAFGRWVLHRAVRAG
jgi:SAM-dependent methyltransferase